MAIIRSKRNRNFSIIGNDLIGNSSLSFKARGLLIYMLSKPDDWKFYTTELAKHSSKEGISAIRTALEEIEKAGYLIRKKKRKDNGKFDGTDWELIDMPTFSPQADNPHANNSTSNNPMSNNPMSNNRTLLRTNTTKNSLNKELKEDICASKNARQLSVSDLKKEFEDIWKRYPNKKGKQKAFNHYKAWRKKSVENTPEAMNHKLDLYLKYIKQRGFSPEYIMYGSTWFNGRFDDDLHVTDVANAENKQDFDLEEMAAETASQLATFDDSDLPF